LQKSFTYDKIADYDKITDKGEIETINVESVVTAVKNLAISRWKKQIEEKIVFAKAINEQEKKSEGEATFATEELKKFAE